MNNKVKTFFVRSKYKSLYEQYLSDIDTGDFASEIFLEATHGIRLKISDDDLKFIHAARTAAHSQHGSKGVPEVSLALMARYILAHPEPLHHFAAEWDDHLNQTQILETRPDIDGKHQTLQVKIVDDDMRQQYKSMTGKTAPQKGKEGDAVVANWWMNEFKDAILVNREHGLQPQVKIVRRGSDSVDLAFRSRGKYMKFNVVRNIPVDMEKFRKQLEDQGFEAGKHGPALLRLSHPTWGDRLHKDGKEVEGQPIEKDPLTGIEYPRINAKKGFFEPGYNKANEKSDPEQMKKYNSEPEFRAEVEKAIVQAVSLTTGAKISMPFDPNDAGDDDKYQIGITGLKKIPGLDDNMVRDIIQSTRTYVFANSGFGDLSNGDYLRKIAANGAMNASKKIKTDKNRRAQDIGGGAEPGGKGDGGRAGGRMQIAAAGGGGGGSGGAGTDVSLSQGAGAAKIGRIATSFQKQDYKQDGGGFTKDDLEDHIHDDPSSLTSDPEIQKYVLKYAQEDPKFAAIANHLRNSGLLLPDVEEPEEEPAVDPTHSYTAKPRPVMAKHEGILSFKNYILRKDKINEMGVVWGNNPSSAKKLKPGETLKGGIQVFGAPWSVGGKGDKNNDVKVK